MSIILSRTDRINEPDSWGYTPLVLAIENGHAEIAKMLLKKLPNIDFDQIDNRGNILLHYAAREGLLEIVEWLWPRTSNANKPDCFGTTPLMLAIIHGRVAVAMTLLEKVPNINFNQSDDEGFTLLLHAVRCDLLEIVKTILTKTDRINEPNSHGITPLTLAFRHKHIKIAETLVNAIANVDEIFIGSEPLLHFVARDGLSDIVSSILTRTNRINEPDGHGHTPLILAIQHGHVETAVRFLERVPDVNLEYSHRNTLLHYAAEKGMLKIVEELLRRNCDVNKSNQWGKTPLMLAREFRRDSVAKLISDEIEKRSTETFYQSWYNYLIGKT